MASLVVLVVQAPATVRQLYRSGDAAVAFVLPQLAGLSHATAIDLGNHSWYEAWWFMRTTVDLPGHLVLWEAAPFVVALAGIASIVWSAWVATGPRSALYTAVGLLAIGDAARTVLFVPTARVGMLLHLGVLCLALLIVWERARTDSLSRRWLVILGAVLACFTAAGATDQLLIFDGLVPFCVASLAWWLRVRSKAAATLALFTIATAVVSVIGSLVLSRVMHNEGVTAAQNLHSFQFVQPSALGASITGTLTGWTTLANGDFFGAQIGVAALTAFVLGMLSLLGLAASLRLVWRETRSWWTAPAGSRTDPARGSRDLFLAFWGAAVCMTIASYCLTSVGAGANNYRYLIAGWGAVGALIGLLASSRHGKTATAICLAAFSLTILVQDLRHGVPPPQSPTYSTTQAVQIERFVLAHGAKVGYAGYSDAENLTWASRFKIEAFPVWACPGRPDSVCKWWFASINTWYVPRQATKSFLITGSETDEIAAPAATFGPAISTATFGRFTVRIYGHDLAAQLLNY